MLPNNATYHYALFRFEYKYLLVLPLLSSARSHECYQKMTHDANLAEWMLPGSEDIKTHSLKPLRFPKNLGKSLVATSPIVVRFSSVLYPHHDFNSKGKRSI